MPKRKGRFKRRGQGMKARKETGKIPQFQDRTVRTRGGITLSVREGGGGITAIRNRRIFSMLKGQGLADKEKVKS